MKWVLEHQLLFIKALIFVIMDLTGEVPHADLNIVDLVISVVIRNDICLFCYH